MHTLTKTQRLLTKAEFNAVFERNIKAHSAFFYSYIAPVECSKLGIIIAKRNHKLAVSRNTIKRVVREYYRIHYSRFPCANIIIIAKRFPKKSTQLLWKDLELLMGRMHEAT